MRPERGVVRLLPWVVALAASGCYLSHSGEPVPAGRYGVFTFASCTGSGIYTMVLICESGAAEVRAGSLGAPGRVDTAGWASTEGDPDRVEVRALRGGLWHLRWDEARGTWIDEDPIDGCAEEGLRVGELDEPLRTLAEEMTCP